MKYGEATMGQFEAVINKLGGMEGLKKFLSGDLALKAVGLLQQVATAVVSAVTRFSGKETFGAKKPKIKLNYLGETFREKFLDKVEENIQETTLVVHRLIKDSVDAPILAELGDSAETSLAHFWEMLSKQANGKSGPLLTNGYWNIFYIRGTDGKVWAVFARWRACDGWRVRASSVEHPGTWHAGRQVVSRKLALGV